VTTQEAERLNSTLEQERVEREKEREVLQDQVDDLSSQLYEAHKEIESLVVCVFVFVFVFVCVCLCVCILAIV
jgi:hypothetical protein